MRAGGHYSDFKPVERARKALLLTQTRDRRGPALQLERLRGGAKVPYIFCIASEI